MIPAWRGWALAVGVLLAIAGIWVWWIGGGPVLLVIGVLAIVSVLLEPIYGRAVARPPAGDWRPTDERFVHPESGALVTVWYDPASGQRRYVADGGDPPP
jgi:hypothetical protein